MGKSVPIINQWYQDIAVNRLFEVLAVDEYSALIDIRYESSFLYKNSIDDCLDKSLKNNQLSRISFADWSKMVIVTAREPEDWRSSLTKSNDTQLLSDKLGDKLTDKIVLPNPDSSSIDNIEAADYLFGWDEF